MKPAQKIFVIGAVCASVITLLVAGAWGGHLQLLDPQGPIATQQRNLLLWVTGLMLIVVVPVFALLAFIAWKYRATNKRAKYQPDWDHNPKLEAVWWGVPGAIIVVLAAITWVSTHTLDPFRPLATNQKPLEVQVVALQWKWLFIYPETGQASVNQVTIPSGRPVRFSITADAPMNSFWVPQLGGQIYAMEGMVTQLNLQADRPGTYQGVSSNLSGTQFADMRFNVRALTPEQFETWQTETKTMPELTSAMAEELARPGTAKVREFATSPNELFEQIVHDTMLGAGSSPTSEHSAH